MSNLQWILQLAILAYVFWYSYRAGRVTLFAVCFAWISQTLVALAFVTYTFTFNQAEREQWGNSFFEGPHVLAFAFLGWIHGLFIAAVAVGIRRVIRKEPLFRFLKDDSEDEKPDA